MSIMDILFSYTGRINRAKFWLGTLISGVIFLVAYLAMVALMGEPVSIANMDQAMNEGAEPEFAYNTGSIIGYIVLTLAYLYSAFAIMVKRCHDRGKSGWWSLIALIPLAGGIWWLIDLGIIEGVKGANAYGPDPLSV